MGQVSDPTATFATSRIAAGALFVHGDRILLVHKTYGNGWDIPGGYAETGESPAAACQRELKEELGIQREVQRLLIVDWAPHVREGDKILDIFDCGDLGADENPSSSNRRAGPMGMGTSPSMPDYVIPRLAGRLTSGHHAYSAARPIYLEHGEPVLPLA